MKPLTAEYTQQLLQKLAKLPADVTSTAIEKTAADLQSINYQPTLLNDVLDFSHMTKSGLMQRIGDLTNEPGLTEQHLNLLFYHYSLLQRLRRNEPEAWDEVNELMEDD